MASPRNIHAAVATPTQITATDGVRFLGCTAASLRSTSPRRPMAKSKRLAATRFPLNTLKRDRSAAARMTRTIQCEPVAYSKATARSEEHTSELQSRPHLVCRLLLEK